MSEFKIGQKCWVIVCDGARALFLRNDGDGQFLNLVEVDVYHEASKATHDLGTDRPGRIHASEGGARSSVESTDLHGKAEEEFVTKIADRLDEYVSGGAIANFVLVAPPRTLGFLRKYMSVAAMNAMKAVVNKDLTKLPVYEIEAHLQRQADI
ncbi:host attachment protein [Rhizobium sp. P28RR-XV]|uniref:host attachment protein n=1 Tax=Rhizobium sp. P28RR-XV TaxID=2726737 RepID=UPI001456B549|nr:host attachment protein [Rhizobium sp. P28RR-XV]NLR86129.1 host attachment protein [Rhizobium sp. P28RR-XV]